MVLMPCAFAPHSAQFAGTSPDLYIIQFPRIKGDLHGYHGPRPRGFPWYSNPRVSLSAFEKVPNWRYLLMAQTLVDMSDFVNYSERDITPWGSTDLVQVLGVKK